MNAFSSGGSTGVDAPTAVTVVGAGYVGLVTATCLASTGRQVILVEVDEARQSQLSAGVLPIHEPGLERMFADVRSLGTLRLSSDLPDVLSLSRTVVIAVGTPPLPDGRANLAHVLTVVATVRAHAHPDTVLVIKSTVPPGTALGIAADLAGKPFPIPVISCPEFLREGRAIHDIFHATRVVVGGADRDAAERVADLMNLSAGTVVATDNTSAELIKYASNAFLALKISFINEMSALCDIIGADVEDVALGMGLDTRIGPAFLNAGLGFGGSCFPKDVSALAKRAADVGHRSSLLEDTLLVNGRMVDRFVKRLRDAVGGDLRGKRIAVLGLAFKPETDDVRESPAIRVVQQLIALGATVLAHDPCAAEKAAPLIDGALPVAWPHMAIRGADAVAVATDWQEYRDLPWAALASTMINPIVVDGRNCLDGAALSGWGYTYHSVGRPMVSPAPKTIVVLRKTQRAASAPPIGDHLISGHAEGTFAARSAKSGPGAIAAGSA